MTATVAVGTLDSPLGEVTLAVSPVGLLAVVLPGEDPAPTLAVARLVGSPVNDPAAVEPYRAALSVFLNGTGPLARVPLDWSLVRGAFRMQALRALYEVPAGEVVSYGELAAMAGRPRAVRAAASACATNPLPLVVPCHRVVRTGGGIGGFGGGVAMKVRLLALEGVRVQGDPPRVVHPPGV